MNGIVLSYIEKDISMSSTMNHRIQRTMHYPINLKPFEITIQFQKKKKKILLLKSPQSMPTSPTSRNNWQISLEYLSQNVLYQVRDQLRIERIATLQGKKPQDISIIKLNRYDCHNELQLKCGEHAVTKILPGLYRTIRSNTIIPLNKPVYFEMSLDNSSASCCIGLSPSTLPYNALVGTQKYTIGIYSKSGMILAHSLQISVPGLACTIETVPSTYGILVSRTTTSISSEFHSIEILFCRFTNSDTIILSELCQFLIPKSIDLYPTLTLDSMHHTILSRFAPSDFIVSFQQWKEIAFQYPIIYALDGTIWSSYT